MLKLICGTKQKCIDWVNCVSNDADYTDFWNPTDLTITKDLNRGEILGAIADDMNYNLFDIPEKKATPQQCWLLFVVDATVQNTQWLINEVIFGGIVTNTPKTYVAQNANIIALKCSGFFWEFQRITMDIPIIVNQYADMVIKKIIKMHTDANIVSLGSLERPDTKIKLAKFSDTRTPFSALQSITEVYYDYDLKIIPIISSSFAGCSVSFERKQKSYAPFIVNADFQNYLGQEKVTIEEDLDNMKNIFQLPFYTEVHRSPETFLQIVSDSTTELNSKVLLAGKPIQADTIKVYVDDFSAVDTTDLLSTSPHNDSPPDGHIASEGYIVRGTISDITGLHLLDASQKNPNWGDVAVLSNPETILFQPDNLTSIRVKELTVNALGSAIVGSYYDSSTIYSTVTEVLNLQKFTVQNPEIYRVGDKIRINSEIAYIISISGQEIDIDREIGILASNQECYVDDFCMSRIIFGLLFLETGELATVQDGNIIPTVMNYEVEDYTIRNHCICFETETTSNSNADRIYVSSISGFFVSDIIEIWKDGNNFPPTQYQILEIFEGSLRINANISTSAGIKVRTLPKAQLQINGGAFGTVSGSNWTVIATSSNTIQKLIDTPREIGFCAVMQKNLVATIKEVNIKHYPQIEVWANGKLLTVSTSDDSAELDIQCFLIEESGRFRLELPEYLDVWPSGSKLIAKYTEKRIQELTSYSEDSMLDISIKRGNPIISTDTRKNWILKGGLSCPKENLMEYVITISEARELLSSIADMRRQEGFQIQIQDIFSESIIDVGQIIKIDLPEYSQKEIPVSRLTRKFLGHNSIFQTQWLYSIEANTIDQVGKLLENVKKATKTIIDTDSISTMQKIIQFAQNENIFLADRTYFEMGPINNYILFYNQVADLRFLYGALSV